METRIGVIGIILENPEHDAAKVNEIISQYSQIVVGRMGIPYRNKGVSVIALTVDGNNDQIGALTGKIGQLPQVTVKSTLVVPKKHSESAEDKK
ncbi:MAG: TM1266 family iron-only hydrogenase system putative regulator [Saccharofermentanales bacterium]